MPNLPYVTAASTLTRMLGKIKQAAVPTAFNQEFVAKTLLMKGGTARSTIPFIKKMGLVSDDGTPTNLYKQFRNEKKSRAAVGTSVRKLYAPLFAMNENVHSLPDAEVRGLIVEATGGQNDSQVTKLTLATFKALKDLAEFGLEPAGDRQQPEPNPDPGASLAGASSVLTSARVAETSGGEAVNFSYTINLNLPITTDAEVFNAIFRSLREHLLQK